MNVLTWVEKKAKGFKWYDFSALKLCVLAFALWLAKIWAPILSLDAWVYAAVWIIAGAYLYMRLLR